MDRIYLHSCAQFLDRLPRKDFIEYTLPLPDGIYGGIAPPGKCLHDRYFYAVQNGFFTYGNRMIQNLSNEMMRARDDPMPSDRYPTEITQFRVDHDGFVIQDIPFQYLLL